jgi:hypothetical protein
VGSTAAGIKNPAPEGTGENDPPGRQVMDRRDDMSRISGFLQDLRCGRDNWLFILGQEQLREFDLDLSRHTSPLPIRHPLGRARLCVAKPISKFGRTAETIDEFTVVHAAIFINTMFIVKKNAAITIAQQKDVSIAS